VLKLDSAAAAVRGRAAALQYPDGNAAASGATTAGASAMQPRAWAPHLANSVACVAVHMCLCKCARPNPEHRNDGAATVNITSCRVIRIVSWTKVPDFESQSGVAFERTPNHRVA